MVYGPGGSGASLTVAYVTTPVIVLSASDSPVDLRRVADLPCDGIADQVELQSAVTTAAITGGEIWLGPGAYTFSAAVLLPVNRTKEIVIRGFGNPTLTVTGKHLFYPDTFAAHDVLQHIRLEGFTVDGTAVTGKQSLVIGGREDGAFLANLSYHDITLRDIEVIGPATDQTQTNVITPIYLSVYHSTSDQATQDSVTQITIERITVSGCNGAVAVGGLAGTGSNANVWCDDIVVRDIAHEFSSEPTSVWGGSTVILGTEGVGGRCTVERVYSKWSGDNAVEVDGFQSAAIREITSEGVRNLALFVVNKNANVDPDGQHYTVSGVRSSGGFRRTIAIGDDSPFGAIAIDGVSVVFDDDWELATGGLIHAGQGTSRLAIRSLTLRDAHLQADTTVALTGDEFPAVLVISATDALVTLEHIDVSLAGAITGGQTFGPRLAQLSGVDADYSVAHVRYDMAMTGTTAPIGFYLGSVAADDVRAVIREASATIASGTGARVDDNGAALSASRSVALIDCDFSACATAVTVDDVSDAAFVTSVRVAT